jgi:alpha-1,4-digalacturonate transport system substrate-binding protein
MKLLKLALVLTMVAVSLLGSMASAQDSVTIRIMYHKAANEEDILMELIERFEAENPDINVEVDFVGREILDQTLALQLESGEGPDIARVLDLVALNEYYLDLRPYVADASYWDANLDMTNKAINGGTDALYGFMTDVTVTGPYINRTLFEQAGVAVPSDEADQVSWEEWAEACQQVTEATGVPYPMVMDRTGHRLAGPAISMGAKYFDADGNVAIEGDEGFKAMAELMVQWHQDGTMPMEVWGGSGGEGWNPKDLFVNAETVFYMSGSWQVRTFEEEIGDAFDWEAVPSPCGPGGCTGMPGGGLMVGFNHTEHPEAVARFMDYMVSEDVYGEFAARSVLIPQHTGLQTAGVPFATTTEAGADAMNVWLAAQNTLSPIAFDLQFSPYAPTIFNTTRDRLIQVIVGELDLDEAISRMQQDIDDAIAVGQQ